MQADNSEASVDLFTPRSVAVIGASAEANAVTARPLRYLKAHGFRGRLFAVNPRHRRIDDVACYASIAELPERPDVAMIGVSAARLESAVADCAAAGVPLVCIFTAAVEDDARERIRAVAKRGGTRILGPNSLGFIDAHRDIVCTYSQVALLDRIPRGGLSIISQSGGLGGCLLNRAVDSGIGIARFLTPGMGLDLDVAELIERVAASPATRAVALILESAGDGLRFARAVEKLHAAGNRLVVWRIGGSESGRAAAVSHTGALAGDERVFASLCRDLGVLQADSQDELLEVAAACTATRPPAGKSVGIVSSSGGAAIMVADALEAARLGIPVPSAETMAKLRDTLPATASVSNPLDVGAGQGSQTFRTGLTAMLSDPAFDCVVLALTMVAGEQAEQVIPEVIRSIEGATHPAAVVWPAGSLAASWRQRLRENGIAVFERPDFAASALRLLQLKPHAITTNPAAPSAIAAAARSMIAGMAGVQTEWSARRLLGLYGIQSPREDLAQTCEQAVAAARRIGFPVALKVQSPLVPHRARIGALELGLADEQAVAQSYSRLLAALEPRYREKLDGILVQAMVEPEHEVFIGVVCDRAFGPVIACGRGGGQVEQEQAIEFMLPTLDRAMATAWLERMGPGARIGAAGIASMADVIVRLSQLVIDLGPALVELDVNPVALVDGGSRALALDALAVIAAPAGTASRENPASGADR